MTIIIDKINTIINKIDSNISKIARRAKAEELLNEINIDLGNLKEEKYKSIIEAKVKELQDIINKNVNFDDHDIEEEPVQSKSQSDLTNIKNGLTKLASEITELQQKQESGGSELEEWRNLFPGKTLKQAKEELEELRKNSKQNYSTVLKQSDAMSKEWVDKTIEAGGEVPIIGKAVVAPIAGLAVGAFHTAVITNEVVGYAIDKNLDDVRDMAKRVGHGTKELTSKGLDVVGKIADKNLSVQIPFLGADLAIGDGEAQKKINQVETEAWGTRIADKDSMIKDLKEEIQFLKEQVRFFQQQQMNAHIEQPNYPQPPTSFNG